MKIAVSLKIFLLGLLTVSLSSCLVTKKYQRPEKLVDNRLFRTNDSLSATMNFADMPWETVFSDSILQGHIRHALDSNFDIRIALENIRSAQAYLKQAKSGFYPTASLGASVTYQTPSLQSQLGKISNTRNHLIQYELSGSLSWEADIWGKINSQKKAALAAYLSTQAAQQAVRSRLVAGIADAYYRLLSLDAQREVLQEAVTARQQGWEAAKALKASGALTEVAVRQNEAQVLNAQAQLLNTNQQIRIWENALSLMMGSEPAVIMRSSITAQHLPEEMAVGVPYQLLSNRPDVQAAEYDLMHAFELTNIARTGFYPALRITAGGGLQSIDFDKLFNVQSLFANAIGSLTQPLWNQRQIRSQYEIQLSQQQIAYLNYRKIILTAGREVADALYDYQTQDQLFRLKQQEYQALDTATTYSEDLMNYGLANYLEVLTARQNALNARLGSIDAAYGRLSAVVELYRALGGGR